MKKIITAALLFITVSFAFAKEFTVSIGAGKNWKERSNPQVAVWLEDSEGNNLKNLYVTNRASKKNWIGKPKGGRPESLPVWYHSATNSSFDAVTCPTPKGGVIFTGNYNFEAGKEYYICAEFNNSFDYNEKWTKKNSGVNGQPSVIYKAAFTTETKGEIKLDLAGTGSSDGSDGNLHNEIRNLTTAQNIVKLITVTF